MRVRVRSSALMVPLPSRSNRRKTSRRGVLRGISEEAPGEEIATSDFQQQVLHLSQHVAADALQPSLLHVVSNGQLLSTTNTSCALLHVARHRWPGMGVDRPAEQLGQPKEHQGGWCRHAQSHCNLHGKKELQSCRLVRASHRTGKSQKSTRDGKRTRRCEQRPYVPGGRSHIAQ